MGKLRISVDVGGTFTDVVGVNEDGLLSVAKAFTTPDELTKGLLNGIGRLVALVKARNEDVGTLIHGTTIGTNALLERKGAKTGLLTTAGFRDVLEIGRFQRPEEGLYDFNVDNPDPLVPRRLRLEAVERVDSSGKVVTKLDEESVKKAAETFRRENVRSIAVCFLFSFLHPEHERRAREILQRELPEVYISTSSEIAPEFREFERTSTVVINSYLQPIIDRYVEILEARLKSVYPVNALRLIQANGGAMRSGAAKGRAVYLVNSGPAGGATAAAFLGRLMGIPKLIAADAGGTSFDISLIEDGATNVSTDSKFEGLPIKVPMCEINVIGAGGGSIGWIDSGGALNVGPRSAAAVPGAACYNRGGTEPTVTDANVALGRIDPNYFLGGEVKLRKELAEEAIAKKVGEKLHLSVEEAAWSIIRVINARMSKAITVCSTKRGYDLREFSYVPFGGAGALHAVEIAEDLGIPQVVVPPMPAAFSAFGLLIADARYDFVRAYFHEESDASPEAIHEILTELSNQANRELEADGIEAARRIVRWSADLRFEGQSYELNVPIGEEINVAEICRKFSDFHERIYEFKSVGEKAIFVNLRISAIGRSPEIRLPKLEKDGTDSRHAFKGTRRVYFGEFVESDIYDRKLLKAGNVVAGPAVVEEEFSCTVIPPKSVCTVHESGSLVVSVH